MFTRGTLHSITCSPVEHYIRLHVHLWKITFDRIFASKQFYIRSHVHLWNITFDHIFTGEALHYFDHILAGEHYAFDYKFPGEHYTILITFEPMNITLGHRFTGKNGC